MPKRGWMNDPNGPIVWGRQVHLFYQLNPYGTKPENISWGHAVSPDMVHWQHLPVALAPQAGFADSHGVWSGSTTRDGGRCLAFYTAVEDVDGPATATLHGDREMREQQVVAVSTDAGLLQWVKQKKPLVETPPLQPASGFRDPSAWRVGDDWYMTVGSGVVGKYGAVLLYHATVPDGPRANWRYLHPLFAAKGNGRQTADTVGGGTMFECLDFFALDGQHVLLYSTEGKVIWQTGVFDPASLTFQPKRRGVLDTGAYYAPKSMAGPQGERILWGWIQERRPAAQYVAAGWAGVMSLPRVLHVAADGGLRMRVLPGVDALLMGTAQVASGKVRVEGMAAKLRAMLPVDGATLTVEAGGAAMVQLRRVSVARVEINGAVVEAPLADGVTAYVDGSVIEMFFGDRAAHTLRVYPSLKAGAALVASVTGAGSTVQMQTMRAISEDRLTS